MAFPCYCTWKNGCDGIGATIKSNARKSSLKKITDNHILTSKDFYESAKDYFKNIICMYYSKDDYTDASKKLKSD